MERILMISADCHASPKPEDYRVYLESKYHEQLEDNIAEQKLDMESVAATMFPDDSKGREAREEHETRVACATQLEIRLAASEIDGFVSELIFPDNTVGNRVPFTGYWLCGVGPKKYQPELWTAGLRAYNRWLGEHCTPDRQLGVGLLPFHDPEYALNEVKQFKKLGLKGVLPQWDALDPAFPQIYDVAFDPVWQVCAEEGLPVTFHPHAGRPNNFYAYSDDPPRKGEPVELAAAQGAMMYQVEDLFWSRRTLLQMILGGVLDRHPNLQVGFVEMYTDWIPQCLQRMDYYVGRSRRPDLKLENQTQKFVGDRKGGRQGAAEQFGTFCHLLPSEYWKRQCFVGAHAVSVEEFEIRDVIGIENFTYGTDFPHGNSPWKRVKPYLRSTMAVAGVSEPEARLILGENMVRIYGLDPTKLAPIVERVGPLPEEILSIPEGVDLLEGFTSYMKFSVHHPSTSLI